MVRYEACPLISDLNAISVNQKEVSESGKCKCASFGITVLCGKITD